MITTADTGLNWGSMKKAAFPPRRSRKARRYDQFSGFRLAALKDHNERKHRFEDDKKRDKIILPVVQEVTPI
jgi:hypothetical protein